MRYSVEYYLNNFFSLYLDFYSIAIIFVLIGATFLKRNYRTESFNLLYTFNTLAAWSNLAIFLLLIMDLFVAWYGQNSYEFYAFRESRFQVSWTIILTHYFFGFATGLLLFFRKPRTNRFITLLFFLSHCAFLFERIIIYITSQFRDYLPSSWSTYYSISIGRYIYSYAIMMLLLKFIYFRAKKKGRLPFPSVFLK